MSRPVKAVRRTRNMRVVEEVFEPLAGKRILDVGCGRGPLCRALIRRGAVPTGIDVSGEALAHARALCPEVKFLECSASAMPFADGGFDGAVFLNSLHHVPHVEMKQALREALRCVGRGDRALILEPVAEGAYFEVMRPFHDETVIRAQALEAIDDLCREQGAVLRERLTFEVNHPVDSAEEVMRHAVEVDPRRLAKIRRNELQIKESFKRFALPAGDGYVLGQPMIAVTLSQRRDSQGA